MKDSKKNNDANTIISNCMITVERKFNIENNAKISKKVSLKENYKLEVLKSTFIGYAYNVSSEEEISKILKTFREIYSDARHICYAYILGEKEKYDDDSEPTRTAGYPILEYLKKRNYINTLVIVIRYFGGTLLGTGGLIRAYTSCAKESLENSTRITMHNAKKIYMEIPYEKINEVEYILKKSSAKIIFLDYQQQVILEFNILEEKYMFFLNNIYKIFSKESEKEILNKYIKKIERGYIEKYE